MTNKVFNPFTGEQDYTGTTLAEVKADTDIADALSKKHASGSDNQVLPDHVDDLGPTQTGNNGKYLKTNGTTATWETAAGGGDVVGPATNSADYLPQWNGADSKTLKNGVATSAFAPALGADDNYVTDTEKIVIGNTSGTNTGDQTLPTDATIATTDVTTNDASTSKHGWLQKVIAPASGMMKFLGVAYGETIAAWKELFDATSPSTQAFSDSAEAGTAQAAARRDHKHAMMAAPTTVSGNAGTATILATARTIAWVSFNGSANINIPHAGLTNKTADDHSQYPLIAGRFGGQTLIGGTEGGNNLILQSTSHATRGVIHLDDQISFDVTVGPLYFGNFGAPQLNLGGFSVPNYVLQVLSTDTRRMGLGGNADWFTTAPQALLDVRGKADEIQSIIRAWSTQNYNLTEWRNSAGTLLTVIDKNGTLGNVVKTVTVATAATTFAVASNVVKVTGDAGGNTVATITGGISGQISTLIFVDNKVTITDTAATTVDTVNLSAAFTSAANTTLQLVFDGNKWFEISRSVNG